MGRYKSREGQPRAMFLAEETLGETSPTTGSPVVGRAVVFSVVGLIEGIAATVLLLSVALAYHLSVLKIAARDFDFFFYGSFSLLAGAVYASSAAAACNRFLDGERRREWAVSNSLIGWTAALAFALLVTFVAGDIGYVSRVTLTGSYAIGLVLLPAIRRLMQAQLARRIGAGRLHFERIALIGRRADVSSFLVNGEPSRRGRVLTGILYVEDHLDAQGVINDQSVIDFARENLTLGADHMVLLGDLSDLDELERLVGTLKRFALNFVYAPATRNKTLKFLDVVAIGPNNALRFAQKPMSDVAVLIKRSMDLLLASLALALLSPFLLLAAAAIVIDSPGPVIFRQARRGFNGETFMIWKFRSMSVTESGHAMTQARPHDPRVTRIGRFIRATSIDELPQLVNVLLGQMSLVGPRPHAISHDAELSTRMAQYAHRQRIKPGITGWAQVNGFRGETANAAQLEGRVAHDIYYIDNWSLLLDIWVLILTIFSPAARRNAR